MNKITYKVSETVFSSFLTDCEDEKQILLYMEHSKNKNSEEVTITEISDSAAQSLINRGMSVVDIEEELREIAVEMVENHDGLFCDLVDELDSWSGFADGYRAFYMDELNEFYFDAPATKLLDDLTEDFNKYDEFFYFSIYGLESTDDKAGLYRSYTDAEELVDNAINNYNSLSIWHEELNEILEAIA